MVAENHDTCMRIVTDKGKQVTDRDTVDAGHPPTSRINYVLTLFSDCRQEDRYSPVNTSSLGTGRDPHPASSCSKNHYVPVIDSGCPFVDPTTYRYNTSRHHHMAGNAPPPLAPEIMKIQAAFENRTLCNQCSNYALSTRRALESPGLKSLSPTSPPTA